MSRSGSSSKSASKTRSKSRPKTSKSQSKTQTSSFAYNIERFQAPRKSALVTVPGSLPETKPSASIDLFLPSKEPVDVYLNGVLAKENVSGKISLDLVKAQKSQVRIVIRQSSEKSNINATEITVKPGESVTTQLALLE